MKIYGHPLSSCTRKVLMTLAEKGERAELVTIDLFSHEHKHEAHLARHPFGVIPVLDDDGFRLLESRAIIRYLDARYTNSPLTPVSIHERARMDQWLSVDQSYVAPHTRALAVERILKKHAGKPADSEVERAAESALATALNQYNDALSRSPYVAGNSFSLADISILPYVASLPMIGAAHLAEKLIHLRAWHDHVTARASWSVAAPS